MPIDGGSGGASRYLDQDRKVTKFRKGACENCGAMTHQAKNCTERPRKLGARVTGSDIKVVTARPRRAAARLPVTTPSQTLRGPLDRCFSQRGAAAWTQPDEVVQDFDLDWDGKRDRWNGYDPTDYSRQLEGGRQAVGGGTGARVPSWRAHGATVRGKVCLRPTRVGENRRVPSAAARQGDRPAAARVRAVTRRSQWDMRAHTPSLSIHRSSVQETRLARATENKNVGRTTRRRTTRPRPRCGVKPMLSCGGHVRGLTEAGHV